MTDTIGELLNEREKTHGDFRLNSRVFAGIAESYRKGWETAGFPSAVAHHAMHMIATKLARMCSSRYGYTKREHIEDIVGYCELMLREIEPEGDCERAGVEAQGLFSAALVDRLDAAHGHSIGGPEPCPCVAKNEDK